MKILEVVHGFPPTCLAGTELYTFHLSQAFRALGHEVSVLYPVVEPKQKPLSIGVGQFHGLRLFQFNRHGFSGEGRREFLNPEFDAPFARLLEEYAFDVVHFQHLVRLSSNWVRIAKQAGLPVALKLDDMFLYCPLHHLATGDFRYCAAGPEHLDKCHACTRAGSDEPLAAEDEAQQLGTLALRRRLLREAFALADYVHCASEFVRRDSARHGLDNERVETLHTGIAPFDRAPRQRAAGAKLRVGFAAALHRRKGFDVFLEAARRFIARRRASGRESELEFVVRGLPTDHAELETELNALVDGETVFAPGPFGPDARGEVFADLDVLAVPSIGENYPFIIREAFYAGVPVIATRIAGIPEIVRDGQNGFLIQPGSAEDLLGAFEQIAADPGCLQRLDTRPDDVRLIRDEASVLQDRLRALCPTEERVAVAESHAPRCSIVIPVFNRGELTRACLDRLGTIESGGSYELIVVDNASTDGTDALLAKRSDVAQVVTNRENHGFAIACNQGARLARAESILFLNNDTLPEAGWLAPLLQQLAELPEAGIVGARLLYPDRTIQHAGVAVNRIRNGPHHLHRGAPADHPIVTRARELRAVTGACLLIRGELFRQLGGFDEGYRNSFEDVDLCFRAVQGGYRVIYEPRSVVVHLESQSEGRKDHDVVNAQRLAERFPDPLWADSDLRLFQDGIAMATPSPRQVYQMPLPPEPERSRWQTLAEVQMRGIREGIAAVEPLLADPNRWPADAGVLEWAECVCLYHGLRAHADGFRRQRVALAARSTRRASQVEAV